MRTRSRYSALAIAGLPAAAILMLGCSTSGPARSSNAFLSGLKVSGGVADITPAFAKGTAAYILPTNYASNPGAVTVTPTCEDSSATVTVNGVKVTSGSASPAIPLTVGTNTITVKVTALDGQTVQTYTITSTIYAPNTTVTVLDSCNGAPVASAKLSVSNASGTLLQAGIPVDANGQAVLALDGASTYDIAAVGTGTAQSLLTGFDSSRETLASLYCHPLGMLNFSAQAPKLTSIKYGPDGVAWTPVTGNAISDQMANFGALQVTALGVANVAPTAWSGFGVGLNVDQPAWSWAYYGAYYTEETATPIVSGANTLYRSTIDLGIPPLTSYVANTKHWLDVVAYDVANNRTEKKIYLNVTDAAPDTTQADLSAFAPSRVTLQLMTHGVTRSIFSAPADNGGATFEPDLFFSLLDGSNVAQKITGYEVYRSLDANTWTKVATNQFYGLTTASSLVFTDNDPALKLGQTYYYKIRCFNANTTNNGGYSQYSMPLECRFLAPYTTRLVSPATETVTKSLTPKLTFSISNAALWDPAVSDWFYFYLSITEKTNNTASYAMAYRYNFSANRFEYKSGSTWLDATSQVSIDASKSNISIAAPAGYFLPGVTYQWSVFGTSTSNATSFRKFYYPYSDTTSTSYGVALSQGSTYELGYGAVNGYFTLTIDPLAQ